MATKEIETKEEPELSTLVSTPMSDEEFKVMMEIFSKMGVKPKASSKEELEMWMTSYVHGLGLISEENPLALPVVTKSETQSLTSDIETSTIATTTATGITTTATIASSTTISSSPITTVTSSIPGTIVATRKPWLVKFTGQSNEGYSLWRHQLRSLLAEHHSSSDIADAIRSSLQGKAGDIIARLGTAATVDDIVKKMDSIYGEVDEEEDLLHLFYGARQELNESVAEWGCRLEGMLSLLKKQGPLPRSENQMLRTMLWKGLRKKLQDLSGYKYDKIEDFDELRIVLRRIEKQHQSRAPQTEKKDAKPQPAKAAQAPDDLRTMIQKLSAEVASLKKDVGQIDRKYEGYDRKNYKNQDQHDFRNRNNYRSNVPSSESASTFRSPAQQPSQSKQQSDHDADMNGPRCFRCGQRGHIAIGCRVRTDHIRRSQDFRKGPMGRGRP